MCILLKEVCAAIVDVLMPRCVRIPTGHDLRTVVDGFKNDFEFPQCAGVVHTFQLCHLNIVQLIITIENSIRQCWIGWPGRRQSVCKLKFISKRSRRYTVSRLEADYLWPSCSTVGAR